MFKLFNKKGKQKVEQKEPIVSPCSHHWKDFNWYINATYNFSPVGYVNGYKRKPYGILEIVEPYVCIHCKERKNVILDRFETAPMTYERFLEEYKHLMNHEFKDKIKPRALVEDEIHDFQLVDTEYLKFARQLFPDRNI